VARHERVSTGAGRVMADAVEGGHDDGVDRAESFRAFVVRIQERLWLPLVMEVGADAADDGVAQALAYAWQHWDRVRVMDNPDGYVFRAAQRYARRQRPRRPVELPRPEPARLPDVEPGLVDALAGLSPNQRVVVFVIEGCGWTLADAAELLGVSVSTVRNHLARGLARLREVLEVDVDA
jgi:RNA polymerase sigma factor (sigma-70 family)